MRHESQMFQPFDNDADLAEIRPDLAGAPDLEDASSITLWLCGLLEDPLEESNSSQRDAETPSDNPELLRSSEVKCPRVLSKMEDWDEL